VTSEGSPKPRAAPPPPPPADTRESAGVGFQLSGRRALLETGLLVTSVGILVGIAFAFAGQLAAWLLPLVPREVDRRLGEAALLEVDAGARRCSGAAERYTQELGARLVQALPAAPLDFDFRVVDDEQINAFALPGGHVTVQRGLLRSAKTGEELAAVLAHEIQHVVLRHGTRRMLRSLGGRVALGLLFGGTDLDALAGVTGHVVELSYSREEETEADEEGVALLLRAGIDPSGLESFFARLAQEGGPRPPEFLSSHPEPGHRGHGTATSGAHFLPLGALPPVSCTSD